MFKGIVLLFLVVSITLNSSFSSYVLANIDKLKINEEIEIFQIFNETIFMINITSSDLPEIFNFSSELLDKIESYSLIFSDLNLNELSLRWFLGKFNPMLNFIPFLIEKGSVFKITFKDEVVENDKIEKIIEEKFKIILKEIQTENNSKIFISSENYDLNIQTLLDFINYTYGGFYELTKNAPPQLVIYKYSSFESKLILIHITQFAASSEILDEKVFTLNYTKFLRNISSSKFSILSEIKLNLFGMLVLNSTPELNWFTSFETLWITKSTYELSKNETISEFYIQASKLDPFILIKQKVDPAVFNETSELKIILYNFGTEVAKNVTVRLNLPSEIISEKYILNFKEVAPDSIEVKSVKINVTTNESKIIKISSPIATYKHGLTEIKVIGNPLLIGYNVSSFASLSFLFRPLKSPEEVFDIFSNIKAEFNLEIENSGNFNATKIRLELDYINKSIGILEPKNNLTITIELEAQKFKFIPKGSEAFSSLTLTYFNGTEKFKIAIPNSLFYSFSTTYFFVNYLSIIPRSYEENFKLGITTIKFDSKALGYPRSSVLEMELSKLEEVGLKHAGNDSFEVKKGKITVKYSFYRGEEHVISLSLNITKNDHFIIAPLYQKIEPFKFPILIPPAFITSAVLISKTVNSTLISVGDAVEVKVILTNLGEDPIYDVDLRDNIPLGWELISGNNRTFKEKLSQKESLTLNYILKAFSPKSSSLPSAVGEFVVLKSLRVAKSENLSLFIKLNINFDIRDWENNKIDNGIIQIFGKNGTKISEVKIIEGNANWEGFVGEFNIKIIYKNNLVYNQNVLIDPEFLNLKIKSNVHNLRIKILNMFGLIVSNAEVKLLGNITQNAIIIDNNLYLIKGIPKGSYNLQIIIGNYEIIIPLEISEITNNTIEITLPVIILGNIVITFQLFSSLIFLILLAIIIVSFIRNFKIKIKIKKIS